MQEPSVAASIADVTNSGVPVRKPRKSRGRGLRTTTGCSICRKRHMKCDEVKPVCGPCSKGNRPCVYGALPAEINTASANHGIYRVNSVSSADTPGAGDASSPYRRPQTSFSSASEPHTRKSSISARQWPTTPTEDLQMTSPQSNYSNSTGYGTEVAPLRWFGLLAGDAGSLDPTSLETLGDAALARRRCELHPHGVAVSDSRRASQPLPGLAEGVALQNPSKLLQISAISPQPLNGDVDERQFWQAAEPVQLKDHEYDIFQRFVTGVSLWIDLFDPRKYFSAFVPHLAMRNEGLMKAVLALGARHLSIKPMSSGEANIDRTAAVQYYYETLQYLQNAMRFTSYKNSLELLATVLVVSTYEMIDGAGNGWERHLKGVFWIQRSREINGESGGLEQAVWWAWLRQDVWAAFRERRRCFSFFKPTKPYHTMDMYDMASRVVYILAQAVNYSSDEEKQGGEADLPSRILKANNLLNMLEEWRGSLSVHFEPLPVEGPSNRAFRPLWVHPPAFGVSLQMYSMARILLLIHQPAAGGYLEYLGRDRIITDCIDTIGGIALKLSDDASRLMSTQCLFAAGLYCNDEAKRNCIADLIRDHHGHTGWPVNYDLAGELHEEWSKQKPG
ncbi:Zn(II)2Cys6 transcription factor like [Lecanosticta acicola]|uniref:Zn(II)2Cys6 transcription factor like n=1 Tax=Lecanosticta acicola TaxID=111012 RepID=A0AAI8Z216_9PEZI|nr:Zn(II)2Cys6 transcription factor like [Lecanosticta acicola]